MPHLFRSGLFLIMMNCANTYDLISSELWNICFYICCLFLGQQKHPLKSLQVENRKNKLNSLINKCLCNNKSNFENDYHLIFSSGIGTLVSWIGFFSCFYVLFGTTIYYRNSPLCLFFFGIFSLVVSMLISNIHLFGTLDYLHKNIVNNH